MIILMLSREMSEVYFFVINLFINFKINLYYMAGNKWQCSKCGYQTSMVGMVSTVPPVTKCPNGGNHVWARLSRFVHHMFELF